MTFEKFLVAWGKHLRLNDERNGRSAVPFSSRYRFPSPLQQRSPGHLGKIWACWHLPDLSQSSGKHCHLHVQTKFAFSLKQHIYHHKSILIHAQPIHPALFSPCIPASSATGEWHASSTSSASLSANSMPLWKRATFRQCCKKSSRSHLYFIML